MIESDILNDKKASTFPKPPQDVGSLTVRATKVGFHQVVRHPGEVFTMPAGSKGSWFVPVEKTAAAKAKGTVLSDADLA